MSRPFPGQDVPVYAGCLQCSTMRRRKSFAPYSEAAYLLKDPKRYGHRLRCSLIQGCIYDMFRKNMCKYPIRLKKLTHVISATRFRRSRDVGRLTVRYTPPNLCLDHAQNMFLFMRLCTTSTEERSKKTSPS